MLEAPHTPVSKSKILVGINYNEHSKRATTYALTLARRSNAQVCLLHVVDITAYQTALSVGEIIKDELLSDAKKRLEKFCREIDHPELTTMCLMTRVGRPGEEIIQAIEEDPYINLMILGTADRSEGRNKLLPWLVSQIGTKIHIPVTIIPGSITDQQMHAIA